MFRKAFCFGLIALLLFHVPASADTAGRSPAAPAKASSTSKRVIWTLVGIGAGFGAGLFIGLNAYDDAVNSDQKVWTSALVGAAVGGLAGGLLSRNVGRAPQVKTTGSIPRATELRLAPWTSARPSTSEDDELLKRRVRELALR
jgi:4-amino-4-deoxy-L-arabinose transferase-like glycosyltransferase